MDLESTRTTAPSVAKDRQPRICLHCNQLTTHMPSACPIHIKCSRCRKRGHTSTACKAPYSVPAGGPDDPCDHCGGFGHVEEMCSWLWRTFNPTSENVEKMPREAMFVSCFNCGSKRHWGNDCPSLPREKWESDSVWSESYAKKFIIDAEVAVAVGDGHGGEGGGGSGRRQMWQLGLLDDGRD